MRGLDDGFPAVVYFSFFHHLLDTNVTHSFENVKVELVQSCWLVTVIIDFLVVFYQQFWSRNGFRVYGLFTTLLLQYVQT
jgi:hypothetical protein